MIKKLLYIFLCAFISNFLWENLHSYLYVHYKGHAITEVTLIHATLFDAVFITIIGLVCIKVRYFRKRIWYAPCFGLIAAIALERYALGTGRWAYTSLMPVIPVLGVGLTPILQLPLLSFMIYRYIGIGSHDENI